MDNAIVWLPEFLLALLAVALFVAGRFAPRIAAPLATFGLVAVLGVLLGQALTGAIGGAAFLDAVQIGPFAWLSRAAILLGAVAASAMAWGEKHARPGLFFGLLVASSVGALGVAGAADLVILFLALSIMGLALLGMVALGQGRGASEATLKLFVVLAIASGVLLFGLSWIYGLGGSTSFAALGAALQTPDSLLSYVLLVLLGGMAFPVAAIPFHAWLPDTTEGSSHAVGAWMLGGAAIAVVAGLVRLLSIVFATNSGLWMPFVAGLAVLSLVGGGLLALAQANLKRILAFGAIANLGFVLLALMASSHAAASKEALSALLLTGLASAVAAVGLLAGAGAVRAERLEDLAGLHRRSPGLALAMTLCALGMAGLPLAGAFWARVTLVRAMLVYISQSLQFGMLALAVLAMLATVVSVYTYMRIPKAIYLAQAPEQAPSQGEVPAGHGAVVALCALLGLALFLAPAPFWALVTYATRGF